MCTSYSSIYSNSSSSLYSLEFSVTFPRYWDGMSAYQVCRLCAPLQTYMDENETLSYHFFNDAVTG